MTTDPYAKAAHKYDKYIEPFNAGLRQIALKMAPAIRGARVLDVGCGTGTQLKFYMEKGCKAYGIEASTAMFEQAVAKLGGGANLINGDGTGMPFEDDSFDLVTVSLVLHETSPEIRQGILKEMIRITQPEGRMLITDYHPHMRRSLKGAMHKALILFIERLAGGEHWANYKHFIRNGGIPVMAKKHDLKIEKEKIVAGGNVGLYLIGI